MKKKFLSVLFCCALFASCSQEDYFEEVSAKEFQEESVCQYTDLQVASTITVYDSCLQIWGEELPDNLRFESPKMEEMLRVIRFCDLLDESGDVLSEMCEYDEIVELLWPNGYGNY